MRYLPALLVICCPWLHSAPAAAAEAADGVPMASHQPLRLTGMVLDAQRVPRFGRLEVTLDLQATYDNPFDPDDIDVTATFSSPGGPSLVVPGFFYQGYEWHGEADDPQLRPVGGPQWKVRFSPTQTGSWSVKVTARDRSGTVSLPTKRFDCLASDDPGFIRRSPKTPYYLQFDNGRPYFAVGENLCWGSVPQYRQWMRRLGRAGGNYCRIWLVRWNMGLEWTPGRGSGTYYGAGRYSQDNAFRLDAVMDIARENGLCAMLCLGYHGELMNTRAYFGEECWSENPYNVANGGPCATPGDFWTNERARKLYRQRLRYYLARYGWDSHVLSWELWNEVQAPAPWVREMSEYLQRHDPNRHLVTTTYGDDAVWQLPSMDYSQTHWYGSVTGGASTAETLAASSRDYTSRFAKPFMMGEFGIDWRDSDAVHDPQGLGTSLHDGLWASVMSRSCGTAAIWYWGTYVHPLNLYREFAAVRRFANRVPWATFRPELASMDPPTIPVALGAPWAEVVLSPPLGWQRQPDGPVTVSPDGTVSGAWASTLFGDAKPDLSSPVTFRADWPQGGTLVMRVDTVSAHSVLSVLVDGTEATRMDLPAGEGEGPWKTTTFASQWGIWQSVYDRDYAVAVPPGQHAVTLRNVSGDWLTLSRVALTGVRDPRYHPFDACGLQDGSLALVWLHDRNSSWQADREGRSPAAISGAVSVLHGLRDGPYRVEWWDTRAGQVLKVDRAVSAGGRLPLAFTTFTRDIAARITQLSTREVQP